MQNLSRVCIGIIGIIALGLGFSNGLLQVPGLALLYPVVLFQLGITSQGSMSALRQGWLVGLFSSFAVLYWLAIPVHDVVGFAWPFAIILAFLACAYVGVYSGLFALACLHIGKLLLYNPWQRCLALACLWYGLEILRGVIFTGFPWLNLSVAFAPWPILIQGASIIGSYGLSALYVFLTLLFFEAVLPAKPNTQKKNQFFMGSMAVIFLTLILLWGYNTLRQSPVSNLEEDKDSFPVIMVEGNVDQNIKWEPQSQQSTLDLYVDLSQSAVRMLREKDASAKPLLIWPETAMPFYLEMHPKFGNVLRRFVLNINTPLLVGAPAVTTNAQGQYQSLNRVYLINEQGAIGGFYDKTHLVPFGEYAPQWLKWNFLEGLLQGIGNFEKGKHVKPVLFGNLSLGVLICYEAVFPHISQEMVRQGSNILVNLSNDAWFGDSSAPRQHLMLSLMRAVEQRRWLVRSTNTGISAVIDDYGRIYFEGEQFKAQSISARAKTVAKVSVFHKLYLYIPFGVLMLFILALLPLCRAKNKNK